MSPQDPNPQQDNSVPAQQVVAPNNVAAEQQPMVSQPMASAVPVAPAPKSRKKIIFWAIALVLLILIGLVVYSTYKGTQQKSHDQALTDWSNANGATYDNLTHALATDYKNVAKDISNRDSAGLETDCETMQSDVSALQAVPSYPKPAVAADMKKGLEQFAAGATDCQAANHSNDTQQSLASLQKAEDEMKAGNDALNQAAANR